MWWSHYTKYRLGTFLGLWSCMLFLQKVDVWIQNSFWYYCTPAINPPLVYFELTCSGHTKQNTNYRLYDCEIVCSLLILWNDWNLWRLNLQNCGIFDFDKSLYFYILIYWLGLILSPKINYTILIKHGTSLLYNI